jgi:Retroviral aspartyl protease
VLIIHELNSTGAHKPSKQLITFTGMVDDHPAYVLIDSGATTNYISESFVNKHKVYTEPLAKPTQAVIADGRPLNVIRTAPHLPIHIQEYADEIDANVLALDRYDLVLSMAWLDAYCPSVDYRAKTVSFEHNSKAITLNHSPMLTQDQHSIVMMMMMYQLRSRSHLLCMIVSCHCKCIL